MLFSTSPISSKNLITTLIPNLLPLEYDTETKRTISLTFNNVGQFFNIETEVEDYEIEDHNAYNSLYTTDRTLFIKRFL